MDADASERTCERALRKAALAGDSAAWEALYERHFGRLYGYVHFRARGRRDRIDDAVQECWLVAVRRLRDFDPERGDFASWLRGIANNVLRGEGRKLARDAASLDSMFTREDASAPDASPAMELCEEIAVALTLIPASYQEVLRAKYESELSVLEIAARSGKTAKTIESLLTRARAAFREALSSLKENP